MSLKERSSSLHRSTLTSDAALAQVLWANRWFSVGNTIVSAALLYHKLTTYSLGKIIEVDPVYVHVGIYIVWLSLEWLRLYFGTVGNLLETVSFLSFFMIFTMVQTAFIILQMTMLPTNELVVVFPYEVASHLLQLCFIALEVGFYFKAVCRIIEHTKAGFAQECYLDQLEERQALLNSKKGL